MAFEWTDEIGLALERELFDMVTDFAACRYIEMPDLGVAVALFVSGDREMLIYFVYENSAWYRVDISSLLRLRLGSEPISSEERNRAVNADDGQPTIVN